MKFLARASVLWLLSLVVVLAQHHHHGGRSMPQQVYKDVGAQQVEEASADEPVCADPSAHQALMKDYDAVKNKASQFEVELKQCQDSSVSAEELQALHDKLNEAQGISSEAATIKQEAASLKQELASKTQMIENLQVKLQSAAKGASLEQEIAKLKREALEKDKEVAKLKQEVTEKDKAAALLLEASAADSSRQEASASCPILPAGSSSEYLFSTSQFQYRSGRLYDFCKEVHRLVREWVATSPLKDLLAKVTEARVELSAAVAPKIAFIKPHCDKAKLAWSTVKTAVFVQYKKLGEPIVTSGVLHAKVLYSRLSVVLARQVDALNDLLTLLLKPVFVKSPILEGYFPTGALDRLFFFLYVDLVIYITFRLFWRLVVRPAHCLLSFALRKTICRRRAQRVQPANTKVNSSGNTHTFKKQHAKHK